MTTGVGRREAAGWKKLCRVAEGDAAVAADVAAVVVVAAAVAAAAAAAFVAAVWNQRQVALAMALS